MATLNRMINAPHANSREMRAYMQAMLEVTGMFAGQEFPLELFMGNFRTHLEPKANYPYPTLHKSGSGMYNLTREGFTYFSSRLTSEPIIPGQKVGRDDVLQMLRNILASEPPDGWILFRVENPANA